MNPPQVYMCSPSWTLLSPPSHSIPLGRPSAPAPCIQYRASNLDWQLISYMIFFFWSTYKLDCYQCMVITRKYIKQIYILFLNILWIVISLNIQFTQFSSIQLLSQVWLFGTPWTAAHQASLSITNSQSLLKLIYIELVMRSNHLILCHPLLLPQSIFPSIRVFANESVLHIKWPKHCSFIFTSILAMNSQDWFPLGWTGWISLLSKGLSRVVSNITVQKHQFFGAQLSL